MLKDSVDSLRLELYQEQAAINIIFIHQTSFHLKHQFVKKVLW